jgi:hypothetical protein
MQGATSLTLHYGLSSPLPVLNSNFMLFYTELNTEKNSDSL